jgi:hypothetical protein
VKLSTRSHWRSLGSPPSVAALRMLCGHGPRRRHRRHKGRSRVKGKGFGIQGGDLGREGRWSQKAIDNLPSCALVSSIVWELWNHPMPHDHWHVCVGGRFGFTPSHQCNGPRGNVPTRTTCWRHPSARICAGIQEPTRWKWTLHIFH